MTPKAQTTKEKVDKLDSIKNLKLLCASEDPTGNLSVLSDSEHWQGSGFNFGHHEKVDKGQDSKRKYYRTGENICKS